MGNKEVNKAIPVGLDDDALDNVSGGTNPTALLVCKRCGTTENIFANSQLCYSCLHEELQADPNFLIWKQIQENAPEPSPNAIPSIAKNQ